MFWHVFSQLKDTLSYLSQEISFFSSGKGTWHDLIESGWQSEEREGTLLSLGSNLQVASLSWCNSWLLGVVAMSLRVVVPSKGWVTPKSREVSPLLSPSCRGGPNPRRGGTLLRGRLPLLQKVPLLPLLLYKEALSPWGRAWNL